MAVMAPCASCLGVAAGEGVGRGPRARRVRWEQQQLSSPKGRSPKAVLGGGAVSIRPSQESVTNFLGSSPH